jgi:hypothetical protein
MNFLFNIPSFASVLKNTPFITSVSENIQRATSHYTPSLAITLLLAELLSSFINLHARAAYPYHCNLQEGRTHILMPQMYYYLHSPRNLILFGLHCNKFVSFIASPKRKAGKCKTEVVDSTLGIRDLRTLVLPEECFGSSTLIFIYC